ncbi:enoyl-CoA hydratase/isomerase family protein [Xanthobacter aminoxidans]|uniref:enoyl-CoA hydratase/isomerase family protein n=1 Tax=Xanthobacter aminoxidans TaxID=186280 RepID=UPI002022ECD5|nr:enoyl-CoA hydratase/isomerase family protein [Xanthobacter aminoxidans]MCL8384275.1 enoyl-CoA hydratase/isomerase family protein [Xanthobacter aminoxidans]
MKIVEIERAGTIAVVRYDRGGKANALSLAAIEALTAAAAELEADTTVRVVVLAGTPTRFSAGVDLKDEALWRPDDDIAARHHAMAAGGRMSERWRRLPQAVIAAVEGPAIGGGAILALAADFRVLADGAFFRFPEVRLGMTLGWGGLPLLSALVGPARAKRLLFCDETVSAAEAVAMGLADRSAPQGGALDAARAWAGEIAACPPLALAMTKRALDGSAGGNWAAAYEADQFLLSRLVSEATS